MPIAQLLSPQQLAERLQQPGLVLLDCRFALDDFLSALRGALRAIDGAAGAGDDGDERAGPELDERRAARGDDAAEVGVGREIQRLLARVRARPGVGVAREDEAHVPRAARAA